jgi:pre-mRNA-splicing factor CWC26
VSKEDFVDLRTKESHRGKKEGKDKEEDQYLAWRGGLAQRREQEERAKRAREEADKPFARYQHDEDHEEMLRVKRRFGDPFAHLHQGGKSGLSSKDEDAAASASLTDRYDSRDLERSGFRIPQVVPPHSWLKRGVADPGNRYNIRPGKHWDGVVRGNGFEKEMFKAMAARQARESEARQWAQADM